MYDAIAAISYRLTAIAVPTFVFTSQYTRSDIFTSQSRIFTEMAPTKKAFRLPHAPVAFSAVAICANCTTAEVVGGQSRQLSNFR